MEHINNQESLKQWFYNFISYFREEHEKLTPDEEKGMDNTNNFLDPCQIEIFWMVNPDYQLIVQSNFNDRPDKEIIVNGPYKSHEFQSKVSPILEDKRWMRVIKQNLPGRYEQFNILGERMALEIYKFFETSKDHSFASEKIEPKRLDEEITFEDICTCIHVGNIGDLDHKIEINKIIEEIKHPEIKQKKIFRMARLESGTDDIHLGFGAHMFPPIVIGTKYKRSIEELVKNKSFNLTLYGKLKMKINNNQIIVKEDGFIFVGSESKEDVLKILNLIMAYGAFYGFPLYAVREHELVMASYSKDSFKDEKQNLIVFEMHRNADTRRAYLIDDYTNPKHNAPIARIEVKPDTIQEILSNTEKLFVHEKLSEDMRLFNEGMTHFMNSEFAPAFIMSWTVIERHYSNLWRILISQKDIKDNRLYKLTKSNQWTIDHILEVFNLQGKIDKITYDNVMDLKKKRNKFYHNGEQVTKEDADTCIKYAMRLLGDKIRLHVSLSDDLMLDKAP